MDKLLSKLSIKRFCLFVSGMEMTSGNSRVLKRVMEPCVVVSAEPHQSETRAALGSKAEKQKRSRQERPHVPLNSLFTVVAISSHLLHNSM